MKYERLTTRRETPLTMSMWPGDSESLKPYNRLAALEDKIEAGELISTVQNEQSEQEIKFFAKHDVEVCQQVVKECLQVLRNMRTVYVRGYYVLGWNDGIDEAIEQLAKKYCIEEEEEK